MKENELLPTDTKELRQFKKYLKMKTTKKGRNYIKKQSFWKTYEGWATPNTNE